MLGDGHLYCNIWVKGNQKIHLSTLEEWLRFDRSKLHRLDGPAVEWADGEEWWFIDGKELDHEGVERWIEENNVDLSTKADQIAFKIYWAR